jgi:hypothetical protein
MHFTSLLSLPVAVGILAAGFAPAQAAPPPNDNIGQATVVVALPFSQSFSTADATTAADDPDCVGTGPTVWFSYIAPASGWLDVDTFGSDYDTTLSAYTGTAGNLVQLECNDDNMSAQSRVVVQVAAGTRYYFMVGAYAGGPGGNLTFNLQQGSPPVQVEVTVVDSVVQPSSGSATVRIRATADQPVPMLFLSGNLIQRSGRGNIMAGAGLLVDTVTNRVEQTLTLKDTTSPRTHGSGFVGGPAKLSAELYYQDPQLGVRLKHVDLDVKLKGGGK